MPLSKNDRTALKFLGTHLLLGTLGGITFGIGALFLDIGNIWTLAWQSGHPVAVILLFFFGLFVTFGSLGMGIGVMTMSWDEEE